MPEKESNSNPPSRSKKLLSSVIRPAFRSLDIKGDRGKATKPVEADPETTLAGTKSPGNLPSKPFDPAANVGFGPTAPRAGAKPVRRPVQTRLPARSAAAMRHDPDHVPEPHLHRRKSGGYIGLFLVILICIAFGAYTLGYLPLDQLFDQGNAAVQSHNDQMVDFILHRVAPIVGLAIAGLIVIVFVRNLVTSKES